METDNNSTCGETDSDGNPNKKTRFCSTILSDLHHAAEEDQEDHPVFRIELIVEPIMENLPHQDRLECRKVNSSLNYIATHYLQYHTPMSFNFQYNQMKETYLVYTRKNSDASIFPLEDLSNILSISWNFPVNSFSFEYGKLDVDSLQTFLSIYGYNIRRLSIHVFYTPKPFQNKIPVHYPPMALCKKLITTQAPFLESLELKYFPRTWSYQVRNPFEELVEDSNSNTIFKNLLNLKYLKLGGWSENPILLESILKIAPNLKQVCTSQNVQSDPIFFNFQDQFKPYCLRQ